MVNLVEIEPTGPKPPPIKPINSIIFLSGKYEDKADFIIYKQIIGNQIKYYSLHNESYEQILNVERYRGQDKYQITFKDNTRTDIYTNANDEVLMGYMIYDVNNRNNKGGSKKKISPKKRRPTKKRKHRKKIRHTKRRPTKRRRAGKSSRAR